MVGEEVVEFNSEVSTLQEGAGKNGSLKSNEDFEPSPHPDPAAIKTHLVRLRRARGFNTPVGRRCSNILEMLDSLPPEGIDFLTPDSTTNQRANLLRSIAIQAAELDAELGKLKALAN